ncbi:MAG: hypothetical protein E5V34_12090, partial [Mesorhizobium sp.]
DVWFVGRLATYRYYNMDQVVGQALATFGRIQQSLPADGTMQMLTQRTMLGQHSEQSPTN